MFSDRRLFSKIAYGEAASQLAPDQREESVEARVGERRANRMIMDARGQGETPKSWKTADMGPALHLKPQQRIHEKRPHHRSLPYTADPHGLHGLGLRIQISSYS